MYASDASGNKHRDASLVSTHHSARHCGATSPPLQYIPYIRQVTCQWGIGLAECHRCKMTDQNLHTITSKEEKMYVVSDQSRLESDKMTMCFFHFGDRH